MNVKRFFKNICDLFIKKLVKNKKVKSLKIGKGEEKTKNTSSSKVL